MPKATGLSKTFAKYIDRDSVIIGYVRGGDRSVAETRTGAAKLYPFKLNSPNYLKFVACGGLSNSSGGYYIEAAHVAEGGSLPADNAANTWIRLGAITFSGYAQREVGFTGLQIEQLIRGGTSPSISGDARVVALRFVAGTGTGQDGNGLAAPASPSSSGNQVHIERA
jgi:hypothetical protein